MNQIPVYQHPFVDVFKATKLNEWQLSHKEGDVTEIYDKILTKNVIKVSGVTTASNYFQVPASKHLPKKSLGLIGKYVYSIVNVPPGKSFVIHYDYMVNETRLVRVSLSNIYKEFKNLNGNSLQIPVTIPYGKWTMLAINVYDILEQNQVFQAGVKHAFFMRSLQITANIQVRGIYTSDIKYTFQSLPKEMAFKLLKGQDWFQQYSWFEYPPQEVSNEQNVTQKENIVQNTDEKIAQQTKTKSILKASKPVSSKIRGKSVKFNSKNEEETKAVDLNTDLEEVKQQDQDDELERDNDVQRQQNNFNYEEMIKGRDVIERTIYEIEDLKSQFQMNLEQKNLVNDAQVTIFADSRHQSAIPIGTVSRSKQSKEIFILKPNPIMRLDRVIGMHPKYSSGQIFYNKDLKLSRELLFTQANLLLGYYPPQQRQRLFYDHPTQSIEHFYVEGNYAFTATRGVKEDSKDYEISIWDTQESSCLFTFKPPFQTIHSISMSNDNEHLSLAGKDFQKRDLMLIYAFKDMIKYKKVEIYARQLSDFDIVNLRFNDALSNSLASCGKENIRFFKIKNNHLPSQSVTLNNTGRGKIFNHSVVSYTLNEKNQKKPAYVFVTTTCGLLYFANYNTRQIDKIIQIHEDSITSIVLSPEKNFCVTSSINGILRLWSPDFSKLISEVNTQQPILSCDVSQKEIAVLTSQGGISVLDLEQSSFNVLIRSHQENIIDVCYNKMVQKLVSIGHDQRIYIWNAETMEVVNEFTTQNDIAIKVSTSVQDCTVVVGFKSGFVRIFDLQQGKLVAETMIYESPIMDLQYSDDNRFLGVFYRSSKIVIFNVEKGYQPIKTIDYDFPNDNYFSLAFSPDGKYLANISSNANNVTIWETKNFSLKFHLDLTGDVISKIRFAPNSKDFVVLTTSSKLKFYRLTFSELLFIKEAFGVTDLECMDFEISNNNKFIICCGKEGVVKVYDYFMRGDVIASTQAFLGHFKFPHRVCIQEDLRFIYTIGDGNGIYKWIFYGDKEMPVDITKHYEEIEEKKPQQEKTKANTTLSGSLQRDLNEPVFEDEQLMKLTEKQLEEYRQSIQEGIVNEQQQQEQIYQDILKSSQIDPMIMETQKLKTQAAGQTFGLSHQPLIQYNQSGYRHEKYDIELKKVLSCSIGSGVKNNLVWNKERRYIAYTSQNIVIVEDLNQEKTQRLLKEGNDKLYQLKLSPNQKYFLAFTREGTIDGFPCIFIWDANTLRKLNQIAINDSELVAVEFSAHSNMLLVISRSQNNNTKSPSNESQSSNVVSCISVWDFLEGHKDILCKSHLPLSVIDGRWNYFLGDSNEFVTISDRKYHYWKISNTLNLQYQEGDISKKKDPFSSKEDRLTALEFIVPTPEQISVYLLIGLNTGYVWVLDSRANQFLYNVKLNDYPIRFITTSYSRIIIEGSKDTQMHCWQQGVGDFDKSDPNSFFLSKELNLTLDGFPQAVSYDESGHECMVSTSSGTIWFLSWTEMATIKLKSCHSPQYQINCLDYKYIPPSQFQIYQQQDEFYQFDQNYMIASSGKDGIIKLWNMYDAEFVLQFIVPKEECVSIAMHQFKPFMVASFTDGFIRFFEVNKSKNLGRCQIYGDQEKSVTDYLISLRILPSGNHILGASKNGQIILIYVQQWDPLAIKIEQLASINTCVHSFDVSFLEPYNKWLVGTSNGKIIVYNRKDFNSFQQEIFDEENPPKYNFMDSLNLLDYVDNNFTESKRCNTLDHYYSISKRNLVFNEVEPQNECQGLFSNLDLTIYLGFIRKCNYIVMRNFELHQVVKRIMLQSLPIELCITPNSPFFIVLQSDNFIKMIDFVNEENTCEIRTIHEEAKIMKICPNGRYIVTGGDKGDICVWNVKKVQPNVVPSHLDEF